MNHIQTWQQGRFIDKPEYNYMDELWKDERRKQEAHMVRPAPESNAICWCSDPQNASWIAQRLNLASILEQRILIMSNPTTLPDFNPSDSDVVAEIKAKTEDLMAYIAVNVPDNRHRSIALTNYEQAAMWAVKANFV